MTEDKLNLSKAINICKTSEQASKKLDGFEGKSKTDKVSVVENRSTKKNQNENFDCKRCGTNYKRLECPAFNKLGTNCNIKGHFAKMCRTKKKYGNKQKNRVNALEESSNSEDDVYISTITTGDKKNWTEKIQVGDMKFTVKLDTRSEYNVLPKASLKPSRTKIVISYTDVKMAVLGESELQ